MAKLQQELQKIMDLIKALRKPFLPETKAKKKERQEDNKMGKQY